MQSLNIALVSAAWRTDPRGNRTTIERWAKFAAPHRVFCVTTDEAAAFAQSLDLVHGYHLIHGGLAAKDLAARLRVPLVLSLGGTDLLAWREGRDQERLASLLGPGALITGAFASFADDLPKHLRYRVIPRSHEGSGLVSPPATSGQGLKVLLPSGLREVKGILEAVRLAIPLHAEGLVASLRILGAPLDAQYTARVSAEIAAHPWISHAMISAEAMAEAYASADLCWNTSRFEGGSNAILESLFAGRPVFATDAPGNREFLEEASPRIGLLADIEDLVRIRAFHEQLARESRAARQERALACAAFVRAKFSPRAESRALHSVWEEAVATS